MLTSGDRVERYEVVRPLGVGATARVYLVRHVDLDVLYALKVLHVPKLRERLLREGRIQAQLRHPHVVAVLDVLEVAGNPALVLEYVPGPTLEGMLHRFRPHVGQVDALARGLLDAVAAAHATGLVHRDLKPSNVLVEVTDTDVVPRVTDFGIAKLLDEVGSTRSGATMGTPGYMAPEQIRSSADVDARADVFSLGCVLYELCAGMCPFPGEDLVSLHERMAARDYVALSEVAPSVPSRMRSAIEAALRPDPEDRPATAQALGELWAAGTAAPADVWEDEHIEILRGQRDAFPRTPPTGSVDSGVPAWSLDVAPPTVAVRPRRQPWGVVVGALVAGLILFGIGSRVQTDVPPKRAPAAPPVPARAIPPIAAPRPARAAPPPPAPPPPSPSPSPSPSSRPVAAAVAPVPVPVPAPAPVRSTAARWAVSGASEAWLRDVDGALHPPGAVAPGTYRLVVRLGAATTEALTTTLAPGDRRSFTCAAALRTCREEAP